MNAIAAITGFNVPILWIAAGIVLLIVEILHPLGFFISFSAAALAVALKSYLWPQSPQWGGFFDEAMFCVIGVVLVLPFRKFARKYLDKAPNINDL